MTEVNLLMLLKDWHDRKRHPLVSFTGAQCIQHFDQPVTIGHIWFGDFDVAMIQEDRIIFAGWRQRNNPDFWPVKELIAADPEFFTKLDGALKYIEGALS